MATDLNNNQSVADSDLQAQSVAAQDLNQSVPGEQDGILADGSKESEQTVKYETFKKANEKSRAEETARILAEDKLAQSVQQTQTLVDQLATAQQPAQSAQPVSAYDQAKIDLGWANEEYPTEAQRSQINSRMFEIQNIAANQRAQAIATQQFVLSHSDCSEVVGRGVGTRNFQPSSELTEILNKKPTLTASAQTLEGAYEIVMAQRELDKLQKQNIVNDEHLQQNAIDTKLAPVSGAAAAGGAMSSAQGAITLEQQQENEARVAAGEFNT